MCTYVKMEILFELCMTHLINNKVRGVTFLSFIEEKFKQGGTALLKGPRKAGILLLPHLLDFECVYLKKNKCVLIRSSRGETVSLLTKTPSSLKYIF